MSTINVEVHGADRSAAKGKSGSPVTTTGVNVASITGYTLNDRILRVTPALSSTLGLPAGVYERVGQDSSGNPTYAPYNR